MNQTPAEWLEAEFESKWAMNGQVAPCYDYPNVNHFLVCNEIIRSMISLKEDNVSGVMGTDSAHSCSKYVRNYVLYEKMETMTYTIACMHGWEEDYISLKGETDDVRIWT